MKKLISTVLILIVANFCVEGISSSTGAAPVVKNTIDSPKCC